MFVFTVCLANSHGESKCCESLRQAGAVSGAYHRRRPPISCFLSPLSGVCQKKTHVVVPAVYVSSRLFRRTTIAAIRTHFAVLPGTPYSCVWFRAFLGAQPLSIWPHTKYAFSNPPHFSLGVHASSVYIGMIRGVYDDCTPTATVDT